MPTKLETSETNNAFTVCDCSTQNPLLKKTPILSSLYLRKQKPHPFLMSLELVPATATCLLVTLWVSEADAKRFEMNTSSVNGSM